MQHKHAQLIKAWADGAQIEYFNPATKEWVLVKYPDWDANAQYRVYDKFQELKEAYRKGKAIQFKSRVTDQWEPASTPNWSENTEYRIKPDTHAKVRDAYKNGASIQYKDLSGWHDTDFPSFSEDVLYRVKPKENYELYKSVNPKSVEFHCEVCGAWHNLSNWQEILGGEVDWESTEFRLIKNANPKQEFIDAHAEGKVVEYWCEPCKAWHKLGRDFLSWEIIDKYRIQPKVNPEVVTVSERMQLQYWQKASAVSIKSPAPNCLFTFDANTKELLSAEVIKN